MTILKNLLLIFDNCIKMCIHKIITANLQNFNPSFKKDLALSKFVIFFYSNQTIFQISYQCENTISQCKITIFFYIDECLTSIFNVYYKDKHNYCNIISITLNLVQLSVQTFVYCKSSCLSLKFKYVFNSFLKIYEFCENFLETEENIVNLYQWL